MRVLVVFAIAFGFGCGSKTSGSSVDASGGGDGNSDGSGSSGGSVKLTITNPPGTPATFSYLVAFEDGDGAWTDAPAPTGTTYTLPVASSTYGVAFTCVAPAQRLVSLGLFATAEVPSLTITLPARCTDVAPATAKLTGTVSHTPGTGVLVVTAGGRTALVKANGTYSLDLPPGTYDVFVVQTALGTGGGAPTAILVERGVVMGTADQTEDLDFTAAAAPHLFAVTIPNPPTTGQITTDTTLTAAGPSTLDLITVASGGGGNGSGNPPTFQTASLAAAQMSPADAYAQQVSVTSNGATGTVTEFHRDAGRAHVPGAGAARRDAVVGPDHDAVPRGRADVERVRRRDRLRRRRAPELRRRRRGYVHALERGGVGDLRGRVAEVPDAGSVEADRLGRKLQLVAGTAVDGTVAAETSTAGAGDFTATTPKVGTTRSTASADFTATP